MNERRSVNIVEFERLERVQLEIAEALKKLSETVTELTLTVNKQMVIHESYRELIELQIRALNEKVETLTRDKKDEVARLRIVEDKITEGQGFLSGTNKTASVIWAAIAAVSGFIGWVLGR